MSVETDLLDLFVANSVEQIEKNNGEMLRNRFAKATVEELESMSGYRENYAQIRECKVELEEILARNAASPHGQMKECLERFHFDKQRGNEKRLKVLGELVRRALHGEWEQKEPQAFQSFKTKCEIILEWYPYFLSYTNRDAQVTNGSFDKLIKFALRTTADERKVRNLIAPIIAKLFEQNNLRGFFDAENVRSGDDLGDEIFHHVQRSWAFVQLVEPAVFQQPKAGDRNWAFEEYQKFGEAATRLQALAATNYPRRYHFVIAAAE